MKILIVDDNENNSKTLSEMFMVHGFKTVVAPDGIEALSLLRTHTDVDFIVSDVNMPHMDGVRLVEEIRKNGDNTPFILYTSNNPSDLEEIVTRMGANKFIANSTGKKLLEAIVNKLNKAFNHQDILAKRFLNET
jgi:CheY-like chemotaxis protein